MLFLLLELMEIFRDSFFNAEIKRVGNDCMSDAHFVEQGEALMEESEVFEVKVMTGVQTDSRLSGFLRSEDKGSDSRIAVGIIIIGVRLGVEFHSVNTYFGSFSHLHRVSLDKE